MELRVERRKLRNWRIVFKWASIHYEFKSAGLCYLLRAAYEVGTTESRMWR